MTETTTATHTPPHSSSTKKKKKSKKSKRKHDDLRSPDGSTTCNGNGDAVELSSNGKKKKKQKKDKKEKDKRDRLSDVSMKDVDGVNEQQSTTTIPDNVTRIQQTTDGTPSNNNKNSIFSFLPSKPSTNSSSSPYQVKSLLGTAALLPTSLGNIPRCIKSQLQSLLLMYDSNLGGVLISLEDGVSLLPMDSGGNGSGGNGNRGGRNTLTGGRIVDDLPYIHYRFQVKGLVFCPAVGMKVRV